MCTCITVFEKGSDTFITYLLLIKQFSRDVHLLDSSVVNYYGRDVHLLNNNNNKKSEAALTNEKWKRALNLWKCIYYKNLKAAKSGGRY